MKNILRYNAMAIALIAFVQTAYCQNDVTDDIEKYIKSNLGLTNFMVLGVNKTQYAKCVESVNFHDPEKKLLSVNLDKVEFTDDGTGYDLIGSDGIMTSTVLFEYLAGEKPLLAGEYRKIKDATVIHDPLLDHDLSGKFIVEIACDVSWISCDQGGSCPACRLGKWPNGCVRVRNCRAKVRFEW